MAGVCANSGSVVICNERRLPIGMLMPLTGHFAQTERYTAQAGASLPLRKQLWKQIVQAKVMAQARLLKETDGGDQGLSRLARQVRSGDPSNIEGQAARRYWAVIFGEGFRRIPRGKDSVNSLLNYGYSVLRAVIARAICAAGLHPTLGIHHHSRYNAFCLADDLIEPYRPTVDRLALSLVRKRGADPPLDTESKSHLIGGLMAVRPDCNGERRVLFDAFSRMAASLAAVYLGERKRLLLPRI